MNSNNIDQEKRTDSQSISRRDALKLTAAAMAGALIPNLRAAAALIEEVAGGGTRKTIVSPKAFVYAELQISVPFGQAPWEAINKTLLLQPGLLNMTWLAGTGNNSLGGIYVFDSIENARKFVLGYLPDQAKNLGVAQTTRLFDATSVADACRDMNSAHFGHRLDHKPGAFVYTEVQVSVPFDKFPWRERNRVLKKQPGLLSKTWLSGLHTHTLGGIDAFDTIENARKYALDDFPHIAGKLNAAFYTRVFNAGVVESASRQMRSPFFS